VTTKDDLWGRQPGDLAEFFFSRQSILLWALKTHRRNRAKYALECEFLAKEKRVVRLRNAREVERFVAAA
jgi:hypothetical protein